MDKIDEFDVNNVTENRSVICEWAVFVDCIHEFDCQFIRLVDSLCHFIMGCGFSVDQSNFHHFTDLIKNDLKDHGA